jgi:transketolase N-terminal domain/subunit
MPAAEFGLDNLVAFVVYNRRQPDGYVPEICDIAPVAEE